MEKGTCTVILKRTDCIEKVNKIINDGISHGNYIDNTNQYLMHFQHFLCYDKINHFSNHQLFFYNCKNNWVWGDLVSRFACNTGL